MPSESCAERKNHACVVQLSEGQDGPTSPDPKARQIPDGCHHLIFLRSVDISRELQCYSCSVDQIVGAEPDQSAGSKPKAGLSCVAALPRTLVRSIRGARQHTSDHDRFRARGFGRSRAQDSTSCEFSRRGEQNRSLESADRRVEAATFTTHALAYLRPTR